MKSPTGPALASTISTRRVVTEFALMTGKALAAGLATGLAVALVVAALAALSS